jgi:hypothetical protein
MFRRSHVLLKCFCTSGGTKCLQKVRHR